MSLVRAYHAGYASEIQRFLDGAEGISESQSTNNWLGRGVYFWESDHRRAEKWAIRNVREMILECHLETDGQQIQICLWNCQVIRSPRKYIGSSFRGL